MNILITGGYGFIGSHIADRFFKEGHKIYIIDNLSTGNKKNLTISHKFYNLDIKSEKCEEVFKANNFDIVINSISYPKLSSPHENLMSFINILSLSKKYKVKKYIYISSTEVYGKQTNSYIDESALENPTTSTGIYKLSEESYCLNQDNLSELKTLCLRLSAIYGPRQNSTGENSFLFSIFNKTLEASKMLLKPHLRCCINNFGSKFRLLSKQLSLTEQLPLIEDGKLEASKMLLNENELKDFLYVEDAVDAIYKLALSSLTGKFNICSNIALSTKEFLSEINKHSNVDNLNLLFSNVNECNTYSLNNKALKSSVGWKMKYSLDEGLKNTLNYFSKNKTTSEVVLNKKAENSFIKYMLPYIENLLLFLFIVYLKCRVINNNTLSDTLTTDFTVFYIIIMAAFYGMKQGIIASFLSSSFYTLLFFKVFQGDIATFLYDSQYFTHLFFYILLGVVIGYATDNKNKTICSKDFEYENLNEKYNFTKQLYEETIIVKNQLQNQIINSEDSFGKIYEITKQLDTLHPEKVFNSAIHVLEDVIKTNSVSIYLLDSSELFLRLKSKSNNSSINTPNSIEISTSNELKTVIDSKTILINKNITKDSPIMMAPIIDKDKVLAVVCIYHMDFNKLTLYTQNLFKITVSLITSALTKAYRYEEYKIEDKYLPNTKILKAEYFMKTIKLKDDLKTSSGIDYTLIRVSEPSLSLHEIYEKLSTTVRETDFIGLDNNSNLMILLSNSNNTTAQVPLNNIKALNIDASIMCHASIICPSDIITNFNIIDTVATMNNNDIIDNSYIIHDDSLLHGAHIINKDDELYE